MKTLTLEQALKGTARMWHWLAQHPDMSKSRYFAANPHLKVPEHLCYCCAYDTQHRLKKEAPCSCCPLISLWPENEGCLSLSSPFHIWLNNFRAKEKVGLLLCSNAATLIYNAALHELETKCNVIFDINIDNNINEYII